VYRPPGINVTTILMAACNFMGWVIIDYSAPHARLTLLIFSVIILVGYVVLWAYWSGRNWARILVLISSVVAISNLRFWNSPSTALLETPDRVMLAFEFVLGVFLLFWLNTTGIHAFFNQSKT
jgi:glucose-6-phosphate-specific signal transduction histidine kinase